MFKHILKTEEEKEIARMLIGAAMLHASVSTNDNKSMQTRVDEALQITDYFISKISV